MTGYENRRDEPEHGTNEVNSSGCNAFRVPVGVPRSGSEAEHLSEPSPDLGHSSTNSIKKVDGSWACIIQE